MRLVLLGLLLLISTNVLSHEVSGVFALENRYYPEPGLYNNSDQSELNLILKPGYNHSWDSDRKLVSVVPYLRLSDPDNNKTIVDIREAVFVSAHDSFEFKAGITKVFWGVTEGIHLVDAINQTSLVENPDGEDKLGQPLIGLTYFTNDYGQLEYYLLPYFRERTFPGVKGRYRTIVIMQTDTPLYQHEDEQRHIDHAARYSKTIDNLDIGISFFRGTDREPMFKVNSLGGFSPHYVQVEQFGLDLQYIC